MRYVSYGAIVIAALALLVGVIAQLFKVQIGEYLFDRALSAQLQFADAERPDGLHVILVGTGSPMGDPTRMGPSTAVIAGERIFIVDAGSGSPRNLGRFNVPVGRVEAAFITHFHSDHIDSLGELMLQRWANGANSSPLTVYGPIGINQVVEGFNQAYARDKIHRIAHHGEEIVPPSGTGGIAKSFLPGAKVVLIDEGDLKVTAFSVAHHPVEPAVGYRFDYKGRSVTLSGDTAYSENLVRNASDTDLFVAEALNTEMVSKMETNFKSRGFSNLEKIMADIPSYHITPLEGAEMAEKAGAEMLVYSHIIPIVPSKYLDAYYKKGTGKAFSGPVIVGQDGMSFTMLPGSEKIIRD